MIKIEENIAAKRYEDRYAKLSKEKVEMIRAPLGKEDHLIKLKRSKEPAKVGDVFVLCYTEGIYIYGKVIEVIKHKTENSWYTGCYVILIFKRASKKKDIAEFKSDTNNLLFAPIIVSIDYWKRGWFETIGNIPLTEEEKNLDYGFFSMEILGRWGSFKKANGEEMDHIPAIWEVYAIKTLTGVYLAVRAEVIIDPELLKV